MTRDTDTDTDAVQLANLARGLPPTDLDPDAADRIAALARRDIGHGPPKRRYVEAVLVAMLVLATLGWLGIKLCEILLR